MLLEFPRHFVHMTGVCIMQITVQSVRGLRWQQYCSDPVGSWFNYSTIPASFPLGQFSVERVECSDLLFNVCGRQRHAERKRMERRGYPYSAWFPSLLQEVSRSTWQHTGLFCFENMALIHLIEREINFKKTLVWIQRFCKVSYICRTLSVFKHQRQETT